MDVYEYPNVPGQYPTVGVTWADAGAMCAAAGKRLCTSDEWDEACGSSMGRRFPYGDEYVPGACPVAEAARSVSGSHFACLSVGGERDLTGGVWEWTSSAFETTGAIAGVSRTRREVRGGSSWSDPSKAVCIPSEGYPETPEDQALPDLGFRCCRGEYAPKPVVAHPGRRKCPEGMISMATGGRDICIDTFEFPNKAAERPTGGLTYGDAVAACAGAGKRICTEEEWLSVCTGQGDRRWPYPGTYVPGRCTDRAGHGSARISGASPECQTPEGVLDLSGGLWEWSSNGPDAGVLHGGGWDFSAGLGQCRSTAHASVDHREPDFGVRCCIGP